MGLFGKLFGSKKKEKKAAVNASQELMNLADEELDNILLEIDFDLVNVAVEYDRVSVSTIKYDYDFIKLIGEKKEEFKNDKLIEKFILDFFGKQKLELLAAKIIHFKFIKEFLGAKLIILFKKYKNKEFSGYKEIYLWHNCAELTHSVIQKNLINMSLEADIDPSVLSDQIDEEAAIGDGKPEKSELDEILAELEETFKNSEGNIENSKKQGEEIHYYESGEVEYKVNYLDGRKQGEEIGFYESGEVQYKVNYLDGREQGEYISYYESGEVEEKINYLDGIEQGERIGYYESGEVQNKVNYIDGKQQGERIGYYESGEVQNKVNYIDGKQQGEFIKYYRSGEVGYKFNYIDGRRQGEEAFYNLNGEKIGDEDNDSKLKAWQLLSGR